MIKTKEQVEADLKLLLEMNGVSDKDKLVTLPHVIADYIGELIMSVGQFQVQNAEIPRTMYFEKQARYLMHEEI